MSTAQALALFGFTGFEALHDPGSDTRLLLGWRDGVLLLAFRGTASRANAVTDLKVPARCLLLIFNTVEKRLWFAARPGGPAWCQSLPRAGVPQHSPRHGAALPAYAVCGGSSTQGCLDTCMPPFLLLASRSSFARPCNRGGTTTGSRPWSTLVGVSAKMTQQGEGKCTCSFGL